MRNETSARHHHDDEDDEDDGGGDPPTESREPEVKNFLDDPTPGCQGRVSEGLRSAL